MLSICTITVNDTVNRPKREDCIESVPQEVQPRKLFTRNMRKIIRKIKKDPTFNERQLTSVLSEQGGKEVTHFKQYKIY